MSVNYKKNKANHKSRRWLIAAIIITLAIMGSIAYLLLKHSPVTRNSAKLTFDSSVTSGEQQAIINAEKSLSNRIQGKIKVETVTTSNNPSFVLEAYVPVTSFNSARQSISKKDLNELQIYVPDDTDPIIQKAIAGELKLKPEQLEAKGIKREDLTDKQVLFLPVDQLTSNIKMLGFEGSYYLDDTSKGAVFRQAVFSDNNIDKLVLNKLPIKASILTVNQTGVTALARTMQIKLQANNNPLYFSEKIAPFLASTDITHTSNEVSFKAGCAYSLTSFCSEPRFIETLKASGIDVVELTGNHNNDLGNQFNADTIRLYHSLGWGTFGGGLNKSEASKPYVVDKKDSKVAFLGYNYADSSNSGVLATATTAGGNPYDGSKTKSDIEKAHQQASFVIVDVQFSECYAYPNAGYVEFPACDKPVPNQAETFKKLIDDGADMVVGTQAHQPQIYELYRGKPIYYGLGNLYFDQTEQPGTERGIILTHYFSNGKLLQSKLSPTFYDKALQTHLLAGDKATEFLQRLSNSRN